MSFYFHSSTLIIGPEQKGLSTVLSFIQKKNLSCHGCTFCHRCKAIASGTDSSLLIIRPEERYTLELLEPVKQTITKQLDDNSSFFFIITKADRLTAACGNSLLKSIEEPPQGYHFVFITERPHAMLPTIASRSFFHTLVQRDQQQYSFAPIAHFFTRLDNNDPLAFTKELDLCTLSEQDCTTQIDYLLSYWTNAYKKALFASNEQQQHTITRMITLCITTLKKPPQPGGTKLFWKNFFLQKQRELFHDTL